MMVGAPVYFDPHPSWLPVQFTTMASMYLRTGNADEADNMLELRG